MIETSVVREYVGSGKTDAQIHTELSALTVNPIPIADLENFLDFEGLAKRNAITGAWQGPLIDTINAGGALGEGLEELFSHINKPRSVYVNTHEVEWAVKAESLLDGLAATSVITQEQHIGFHALGGGYQYPSIVVADVTDAFTLMDAEDEQKALAEAEAAAAASVREETNLFWARFNEKFNAYVAAALDGGAAVGDAEIVDGLQDIVDNWNA
jgi:hypothetical protein